MTLDRFNRRLELSSWRILLAALLLTAGCERPPIDMEQLGFRGVAMEKVTNPRLAALKVPANQVPPAPPPVGESDPANTVYKNVPALGHTGVAEFMRLMGAITTWVAPAQGCVYCHDGGDFESENVYTKIVARRMIEMTQRINRDWKDHVGDTGVTCYTCHRGMPVPGETWHADASASPGGLLGHMAGQNRPGVGLTSLPADPFGSYLVGDASIRIQSGHALPMGNELTIKDAERTYGLMVHMSEALGVNCTYCHNSRAFRPWEESLPTRVNAWHAIRMVREINEEYLGSLTDVFPDDKKGPLGDVLKVNCGTCHAGLPKPLYGVSMVADFPNLAR